jgi:hypothetical protein
MHQKHSFGAHTCDTVTTPCDNEGRISYVTRATTPHTHSQPGIECCHSKAITVNLSLTYPVTTVRRSLLLEDRPIRLSQEYLCLTQLHKSFAHAHLNAWPLDVYNYYWLTQRSRIMFLHVHADAYQNGGSCTARECFQHSEESKHACIANEACCAASHASPSRFRTSKRHISFTTRSTAETTGTIKARIKYAIGLIIKQRFNQ